MRFVLLSLAVVLILVGTLLFLIPANHKVVSVETYVSENISSLSPVKEQLGGTFYVMAIETKGGAGTVSYEDGHNAYTADFTYEIDVAGNPSITTFIVRE